MKIQYDNFDNYYYSNRITYLNGWNLMNIIFDLEKSITNYLYKTVKKKG